MGNKWKSLTIICGKSTFPWRTISIIWTIWMNFLFFELKRLNFSIDLIGRRFATRKFLFYGKKQENFNIFFRIRLAHHSWWIFNFVSAANFFSRKKKTRTFSVTWFQFSNLWFLFFSAIFKNRYRVYTISTALSQIHICHHCLLSYLRLLRLLLLPLPLLNHHSQLTKICSRRLKIIYCTFFEISSIEIANFSHWKIDWKQKKKKKKNYFFHFDTLSKSLIIWLNLSEMKFRKMIIAVPS